jgi:NAD(P)-dependent dehydrogenase (short-subunit alcohol dehydrogenase family)
MPGLEGKIAVITGGSSGIGLATAKRFVKEGAYVFITGRRQAELEKAAAEIGSNVTAVKADVANPNDLDRLYQTVSAKKGKLDIRFANAGIADPVPLPASSAVHVRTNERRAAFVALHVEYIGIPFCQAPEPLTMIEPPSFTRGRAFCTVK